MKTIYLDVDGVLLDWFRPFLAYVRPHMKYEDLKQYSLSTLFGNDRETRELVNDFNNSPVYRNLKPLTSRDRLLNLEAAGYELNIITQVDGDKARGSRLYNLENAFGLDLFKKIIFVPSGEKKTDVLRQIEPYDLELSVVEDNPRFFVDAKADRYIRGYAVRHTYNAAELKDLGIIPYSGVNEIIRHLCAC